MKKTRSEREKDGELTFLLPMSSSFFSFPFCSFLFPYFAQGCGKEGRKGKGQGGASGEKEGTTRAERERGRERYRLPFRLKYCAFAGCPVPPPRIGGSCGVSLEYP